MKISLTKAQYKLLRLASAQSNLSLTTSHKREAYTLQRIKLIKIIDEWTSGESLTYFRVVTTNLGVIFMDKAVQVGEYFEAEIEY